MGRQRPAIGPARFRAGGGNWRVAYIPRCRVEYILWSRRPIGRGPASMDRKGRTILAKNLKALRDLHAMTQERSEERRVGKSVSVSVELGGRRIIKKKIIRTHNTSI